MSDQYQCALGPCAIGLSRTTIIILYDESHDDKNKAALQYLNAAACQLKP